VSIGGGEGNSRNVRRLTASTGCLQQHEDLLVIEMLEAVDVVDDGRGEETLAGEAGGRGGGLGEGGQWHVGLLGAAGALEGIAVRRGGIVEEVGIVGVHGCVVGG
jgi:hypothetical protein